jgi:hypothetical protein
MNKLKSLVDDSLSSAAQIAKQTAKQVVKAPAELGKEAFSQVAGSTNTQVEVNPDAQKQTQDFVKGLYAPTDKSEPKKGENNSPEMDREFQKSLEGKTPEEQQKLIQLRNQLHQQYYQQLTTREKTQEEVERPKERVERLEEQDLQKKEEDKQKKPVLVDKSELAIEANRGVSG